MTVLQRSIGTGIADCTRKFEQLTTIAMRFQKWRPIGR